MSYRNSDRFIGLLSTVLVIEFPHFVKPQRHDKANCLKCTENVAFNYDPPHSPRPPTLPPPPPTHTPLKRHCPSSDTPLGSNNLNSTAQARHPGTLALAQGLATAKLKLLTTYPSPPIQTTPSPPPPHPPPCYPCIATLHIFLARVRLQISQRQQFAVKGDTSRWFRVFLVQTILKLVVDNWNHAQNYLWTTKGRYKHKRRRENKPRSLWRRTETTWNGLASILQVISHFQPIAMAICSPRHLSTASVYWYRNC